MRFFDHSDPCPHCGKPIKLRSFRPPATWCPHCGKPLDPEATGKRIGCHAYFLILVMASMLPGYLGFLLGRLLGEVVNDPAMAFRLAFLAGGDGLGFACLFYWRKVGGSQAKVVLAPIAVFLLFTLVGIKSTVDLGKVGCCVCGITNGIFGSAAAWFIFRKKEDNSSSPPCL